MRFARMMGVATLALGLYAGLGSAVRAATEVAFTQQAFDATQHEGKPILVHIPTAPSRGRSWADWKTLPRSRT